MIFQPRIIILKISKDFPCIVIIVVLFTVCFSISITELTYTVVITFTIFQFFRGFFFGGGVGGGG